MPGSSVLFCNFILCFLGLLGTCLAGEMKSLDDVNNAVASFAKSSIEELAGIEDDFESTIGSIPYYNGKALISISGSLRNMEVRGIGGISNVSVQVNLGGKGTESDPHMIISMEILSSSVRGTHDLKGHIGNTIVLGNTTLDNNTWTVKFSSNFPLTISCRPRITLENGHIKVGDCIPHSLLSRQGAVIDFPGLVNDSRVDPDMLENIKYIVMDRAISWGLHGSVGQPLYKKIMAHLQTKFDEVKVLDMLLLLDMDTNLKVKGYTKEGKKEQVAAANTMNERMNEFSRQIITNFTKTTPDPYRYPYNVPIALVYPLVNITGNLSNIGFHGLARDFRFNVSSSAVTDSYNFVQVSIDIFDAELIGNYDLEGLIVGEKGFGGQGSWSIKNITVIYFLLEPRMELDGIYYKQRSTLMSGFRMELVGSELKMPGLLDNVDIKEEVKNGVLEIVRPQIITLMNSRLSDRMQSLIADEMFRKFAEIPAIDIFTI